MILSIAGRELKTLFYSPLAWSILGILQAVLAYIFLSQLETFLGIQARLSTLTAAPGLTELVIVPLYTSLAMLLLLISPLLSMRLIAEERRNKTFPLLLSAPISHTEIVLGKFFGNYAFFLSIILLISIMPLSLILGSTPDLGKLCANIFALALLCGCFTAIGLYTSCLTSHPTIAAMSAFGILILLWILDWTAGLSHQSSDMLAYFSLLSHFQNMQTGLINSTDISYYILFCSTFLILSVRRLDNDRLRQ